MVDRTLPVATAKRVVHGADVVRGGLLAASVVPLVAFLVVSERIVIGVGGGLITTAYVLFALGMGARIVMLDGVSPRDTSVRITRTRELNAFTELVIAGGGALFLLAPVGWAIYAVSDERLSTIVQASQPTAIGFFFAAFMGSLGVLMVFWRPQIALDPARSRVVRYAFARSLPIKQAQLPYAELTVTSEGYFRTNTSYRVGDVIRGRIGDYSFELEMIEGNLAPALIQQRARAWAAALGATYRTPQEAAQAQLARVGLAA
ncbi:MAG: hypothetical protein AB7S26_01005 [Sandaracinaceae bacterium]